MSLQTYQQTQTTTEAPRQTEYRLFAQVTRGLLRVADQGEDVGRGALVKAIDHNRRLWNTLQFDCAKDENSLGTAERAGIISLAIWVEKYSRQIMRGEGDLRTLIDINRTIMEGLAA